MNRILKNNLLTSITRNNLKNDKAEYVSVVYSANYKNIPPAFVHTIYINMIIYRINFLYSLNF